jgi:hypothetical protein
MLPEIPAQHQRSRKCLDNIEWCVLQDVITRISRLLERAAEAVEAVEAVAAAGHKDQHYQKMPIMFLNTYQLLIVLILPALVHYRAILIPIWHKHQWQVAGLESPGKMGVTVVVG